MMYLLAGCVVYKTDLVLGTSVIFVDSMGIQERAAKLLVAFAEAPIVVNFSSGPVDTEE